MKLICLTCAKLASLLNLLHLCLICLNWAKLGPQCNFSVCVLAKLFVFATAESHTAHDGTRIGRCEGFKWVSYASFEQHVCLGLGPLPTSDNHVPNTLHQVYSVERKNMLQLNNKSYHHSEGDHICLQSFKKSFLTNNFWTKIMEDSCTVCRRTKKYNSAGPA